MTMRRLWASLIFFRRLRQATRAADQFYATCPTLTRNVTVHHSLTTALDVYAPAGAKGCPVLVYVYGGSWNSGSRKLYAPIAERLLPEGVVVVVPDYTSYPAACFPRPTKEIAAAIGWTLDNIENYGGDPRRVVIAAQSAGAQVAGLAALDPQYLRTFGHDPAELCGFAGISGVYDMHAQAKHVGQAGHRRRYVIAVAGGEENLGVASPSQFVRPGLPPFLLIHGDVDGTVPLSISLDFYNRLQGAGVKSELNIYEGSGHSGVLFDALAQPRSRLMLDLLRFIRYASAERPVSDRGPVPVP